MRYVLFTVTQKSSGPARPLKTIFQSSRQSTSTAKDKNMTDPLIEKRRFPRIFFGNQEKVSGIFSIDSDQDISFSSSILNISLGGIQFNQTRQSYRGQQPEDTLILRRIIGMPDLVTLSDIPLQIKWVMDNQYLDHIVMGTEFIPLPESQRKPLQTYIDKCLKLHQHRIND